MNRVATSVYVVDADPAVVETMKRLLVTAGFRARGFSSSAAFLDQHDPALPGCLVLDLDLDGLRPLEALMASGCPRPTVFITGRSDIPTTVRAMKAGAIDVLIKPLDDERLVAAAREASEIDDLARAADDELTPLRRRLATLTGREREVLARLVAGRRNKQIAADLGTVEKTIKVHRARVMQKMVASSLVELVRIADRLGIAPADGSPRSTDRQRSEGEAMAASPPAPGDNPR